MTSSSTEVFPGREMTDVRISLLTACASSRADRKAAARPARLHVSAIETLETRGLLSAAAPINSTPVELAGVNRPTAVVVLPTTLPDDSDISTAAAPASSKPDERALRRVETNPAPSASIAARGSSSPGAIRRSRVQKTSQQDFADSIGPATRSVDPEAGTPAGEGSPSAPELISGLGVGDPSDPAAALASLVGWGTDAADSPGLADGLDGPAAPRQAFARAAWSVAVLESSSENPGDSETAASSGAHGAWPLLVSPRAAPTESEMARGSNLLEGAIRADWEAVDIDLRKFLARLGGLADVSPDREQSGVAWAFWLGAAGAVLVVRRFARIRRRFLGRTAAGELRGFVHRPVRVGPWPLGTP